MQLTSKTKIHHFAYDLGQLPHSHNWRQRNRNQIGQLRELGCIKLDLAKAGVYVEAKDHRPNSRGDNFFMIHLKSPFGNFFQKKQKLTHSILIRPVTNRREIIDEGIYVHPMISG